MKRAPFAIKSLGNTTGHGMPEVLSKEQSPDRIPAGLWRMRMKRIADASLGGRRFRSGARLPAVSGETLAHERTHLVKAVPFAHGLGKGVRFERRGISVRPRGEGGVVDQLVELGERHVDTVHFSVQKHIPLELLEIKRTGEEVRILLRDFKGLLDEGPASIAHFRERTAVLDGEVDEKRELLANGGNSGEDRLNVLRAKDRTDMITSHCDSFVLRFNRTPPEINDVPCG